MADIAVAFAAQFAKALGVEEAFTPNVARWWGTVTARESYRKAAAL